MNKLLKVTAATALLSTPAVYGQIEINENLSVTGFLDMSATYAEDGDNRSSTFDLDQAEIDFLLSFDEVTGQIDLDYQRMDTAGGEIDLEQAFITYDLGNGTSITAGKFLSYHGWETAEPTGLYQFSYAYGDTIPGYHNGISIDHTGDFGSFGLALVDSVYDDDGSLGNAADNYESGLELKLALTPAEGWTVYFGYGLDRADIGNWMPSADRELLNFWTSYESGASTYAFEYNIYTEGALDIDQWLLMWSMAATDDGTVTLRVSNDSREYDGVDWGETKKYTAAYIHTLTDNLALVSEVSLVDTGSDDNIEAAIEALFTF
jgi:hypothetical protein